MDLSSIYDKFDLVSDPEISEEDLGAYIEHTCDAQMAGEIEQFISDDPSLGELARDAISVGAPAPEFEMMLDLKPEDFPRFEDEGIDPSKIELPAFPGDDLDDSLFFPALGAEDDNSFFGTKDFPIVAEMPEQDFMSDIPGGAGGSGDMMFGDLGSPFGSDFGSDFGNDFGSDFGNDIVADPFGTDSF